MSLFERGNYRWRETYLIFFDREHRPVAEIVQSAVRRLGDRFEILDVQSNATGHLDTMTIVIRGESSAMDILYTSGEDLDEQLPEVLDDLRRNPEAMSCQAQMEAVSGATARLDILHFQRASDDDAQSDDDADPSSLFVVLDCLGHLCRGVAVDPQSACFLTEN